MKENNATIDALIEGGVIGAVLGAFLSKDKEEGTMIGALLGAAISATLRANSAAHQTKIPVYVEEEGKLYAISANGKKKFIKNISKPTEIYPTEFTLK